MKPQEIKLLASFRQVGINISRVGGLQVFLQLDRTSVVIGQRGWNVKYLLYFLTCWSALLFIKAAFKHERNYNFSYMIQHARKKTTYVSSKAGNVHLLIKSNLGGGKGGGWLCSQQFCQKLI